MQMARSIEEQLELFCQSQSGKQQIKQAIKTNRRAGIHTGQTVAFAESEGYDMRRILVKYFHDAGLESISENDIHLSELYTDQDGNLRIDLMINDEDLRRPSLYPAGYPDGAYNILTLFIRGWSSSPVYGVWESHGVSVRGRTRKNPDPIIQNAITEFESTHSSIAIPMME